MNIIIFGKGRIGKAVKYYLEKLDLGIRVGFLNKDADVRNCDLIISALPGDAGEKALKLALKHKKDLIDIADVDREYYFKNKKEIERKGILVIPHAGFSPGLVNFICGREVKESNVKEIEISAGSLSKDRSSLPFLWCFEDLIEGHQLKATLVKNGRKIKKPAFSDYKKQKIEKLDAESYLAEGLCSLIDTLKVRNMSYRIIRNLGFHDFFKTLNDRGLLKDKNIESTRKKLESKKQDNLTIGTIKIKNNRKEVVWKMKAFSKKNESLNSMQKITAIFPVLLVKEVLKGNIYKRGLFFPEELGKNRVLFKKIISQIKKQVSLTRI